jgi:hypothetical protein
MWSPTSTLWSTHQPETNAPKPLTLRVGVVGAASPVGARVVRRGMAPCQPKTYRPIETDQRKRSGPLVSPDPFKPATRRAQVGLNLKRIDAERAVPVDTRRRQSPAGAGWNTGRSSTPGAVQGRVRCGSRHKITRVQGPVTPLLLCSTHRRTPHTPTPVR